MLHPIRTRVRRCLPLLAGCLVFGFFFVATEVRAQPPDQKKEEPQQPIPFPDLEKLLPPGTIDPEQMKQLKKLFEGKQEELRKMMEDLKKQLPGGFPDLKLPGMPFGNVEQENRLGAALQKPSRTLIEQLDLPEKQGIVLKSVKGESAAAKAGLKSNDILLELNGKVVPSDLKEFVKQLNEIQKDTAVDAVVLRKGKRETIKGLKLGEIPAAAAPFGGLGLPNFQLQPIQRFQGGPGGGSLSTSRGPFGAFTTKYTEGTVGITISGKVEDKKADVATIEIRDGDKTNTYKSVDEVPEDLRDDVRALIRSIEQGGTFSKTKIRGK